jgi:hypothetical protein
MVRLNPMVQRLLSILNQAKIPIWITDAIQLKEPTTVINNFLATLDKDVECARRPLLLKVMSATETELLKLKMEQPMNTVLVVNKLLLTLPVHLEV